MLSTIVTLVTVLVAALSVYTGIFFIIAIFIYLSPPSAEERQSMERAGYYWDSHKRKYLEKDN